MFYDEDHLLRTIKGITLSTSQDSHHLDPGNPKMKKIVTNKQDDTFKIFNANH